MPSWLAPAPPKPIPGALSLVKLVLAGRGGQLPLDSVFSAGTSPDGQNFRKPIPVRIAKGV